MTVRGIAKFRHWAHGLVIIGLVLTMGSASGIAQQREINNRDSRSIREQFRPVTEKNRRSVVVLLRDGVPCAQGFVVDEAGWVLTKASEMHGTITANSADRLGLEVEAEISEPTCDVALLKLAVDRPMVPVTFASSENLAVGRVVLALTNDAVPSSLGVVSTPPRPVAKDRGLLGVEMGDSRYGPEVTRVLPRTSAELLGLQQGDVILKVDEERYRNRQSLILSLRERKVRDLVELEVLRGDETLKFVVELGSYDQDSDTMNGPISRVRSGFASAFQHDCNVHPDDCGGPIVDLSGDVVGLNIARSGRTGGYAIPVDKLQELLPEMFAAGRRKLVSQSEAH